MAPVINPETGELRQVVSYSEKKVARGVAELLSAENFLKNMEDLTYGDKIARFEDLNALNTRTKKPILHISLNFHPDDKLTTDQLRQIADIYMDRIGFGKQPYLVYQHFDAGHPHLHVVTTLIRPDATRIPTNNLGKKESVAARKEIDQRFGLHRVEDSQLAKAYEPEPVNAQKVVYSKVSTKKAISDVLRFVLKKYRFTSLPEVNAVLQQYNVLADRGAPDSLIYQKGGLVYRVLDEDGRKIGVPIKASDFYFKPILRTLEEKFEKNKPLKKLQALAAKSRIDWTLIKLPKTFQAWSEELRKENIRLVVRRNDQGIIYGLTYIDIKNHAVFNGSDFGKAYSANAITQRFHLPASSAPIKAPDSGLMQSKKTSVPPSKTGRGTPRGGSGGKIRVPKPARAGYPITHQAPDTQTSGDVFNDRFRRKKAATASTPPSRDNRKGSASASPQVSKATVGPASSHPSTRLSVPAATQLPVAGAGKTLLQDLLTEMPPEEIPYELTVEMKKKKRKKRLQQ